MKKSSINTIAFFAAIILIVIAAVTNTVWLGIIVLAAPFLVLPIVLIYYFCFADKIDEIREKKKEKKFKK